MGKNDRLRAIARDTNIVSLQDIHGEPFVIGVRMELESIDVIKTGAGTILEQDGLARKSYSANKIDINIVPYLISPVATNC
jgi:hypothetical protein